MTKASMCIVCSGRKTGNKWLPHSIKEYREDVLARYVGATIDREHKLYPVFSNIAYNLQYLEYLNKCFEDLYITSVLRAQNVKMFVLISSQIIECFLYVKLIEMGVNKDEIWDFGQSLRVAEAKNAFALGTNFYRGELKEMKRLRNHIHIQSPGAISEADYAVFESLEVLNQIKQLLRLFIQKALKMSSADLDHIFYFLQPTAEFIHSIPEEADHIKEEEEK